MSWHATYFPYGCFDSCWPLLAGCSYPGGMFAGTGADAVETHAEDGQAEIVGGGTPVAIEQPEPAPIPDLPVGHWILCVSDSAN